MTQDEDNGAVTQLVKSLLLRKTPVSQVPRELVGKVNQGLEHAKQRAISRGNVSGVKQVHKMQQELANYERKLKLAQRMGGLPLLAHTGRTRKSAACPPLSPPPNELERVLDSLIAGNPLEQKKATYAPFLIKLARRRIADLVAKQDFTAAQQYEDLVKRLFVIDSEFNTENTRANKRITVEERFRNAEVELEALEQEFVAEIKNFRERAEKEKHDLAVRHREEQQTFDHVTENGCPTERYKKFSQRLLNMREQEKFLVHTKRFDEAAEMKERSDALEEEERLEIQRQFMQERAAGRCQLKMYQESEVRCLRDKLLMDEFEIKRDYENVIAAQKRTIENLENRLKMMNDLMKPDAAQGVKREKVQRRRAKTVSAVRIHGKDPTMPPRERVRCLNRLRV